MADASLMPPSPVLSTTLLTKRCESYSPKVSENVDIATQYKCYGRLFRDECLCLTEVVFVEWNSVYCLSFGRIKRNEKEIQAEVKMCTGADVSLAQYFNRKLNTDDRCHWG